MVCEAHLEVRLNSFDGLLYASRCALRQDILCEFVFVGELFPSPSAPNPLPVKQQSKMAASKTWSVVRSVLNEFRSCVPFYKDNQL